jgi:3-oxoacyl-[acyl-carrier-protein] synthase II
MMKPVYILSASAISPQGTFNPSEFLQPVNTTADGKLFVIDPDYRQFINPVAIRRMSRLIKMGISAGMNSLKLAAVEVPDAIITGTGLGSMTDMEHFLKDMISMKEQALNPTYFIQSTYNSVNGWIALQTKSTGYNQTYVNRGFSLELSLLDGQLFLNDYTQRKTALVGSFDELTHDYFIVKDKCNYWKKDIPASQELLNHSNTPGTIAGEGTTFVTLSNTPDNAICTLRGLKLIQHPEVRNIEQQVKEFLSEHNINPEDIDLMICGLNGDANFQPLYDEAFKLIPSTTTIAAFKHLSGEYPTASGFALWMATHLITTQQMPSEVVYRQGSSSPLRTILIMNHYILDTVSLMLLSV